MCIRDRLQIIGAALGRDIQLIALSEAQAREQWKAKGYSADVIEFFVMVHGNTPPIGYTVTQTVQQVTGHPPRSFAQWVQEHLGRFRA